MIPKYVSYSIDPLYELELRLVTMLAGLQIILCLKINMSLIH